MPPEIATLAFVTGILGLFWLDHDPDARTSKALWIPAVWLLIAGSRAPTLWLNTEPVVTSADKYNIEANPVNVVVFSVLLTAGLIVLFRRGQQVGAILQANWPILLFFSYCAFSTLWSDYSEAAFRKWIRSLGDLVMVLIVLTDFERVAALKRLLARTAFLLLPLSVLFIKYYPSIGRRLTNSWTMETTGVALQKNSLGLVCLILGLGSLWQFLKHYQTKGEPGRGRHLLAQGVILAMAMWLIWVSNSLTSLSSFLLTGGLLMITDRIRPGRKPVNVHLLVAVVLCLPLCALFLDSSGHVVESLGRDPTFTGRTGIWHQVLGLVRNPVFGTGFESFWLGHRIQAMWDDNPNFMINEAHNGYLEVYLNLGWCGITLLAVLIVTGYRNVLVALRRDPDTGSLRLAYFSAVLICNLTTAQFRMATPPWIFFLLAIMAVPEPAASRIATRSRRRSPRELRWASARNSPRVHCWVTWGDQLWSFD